MLNVIKNILWMSLKEKPSTESEKTTEIYWLPPIDLKSNEADMQFVNV